MSNHPARWQAISGLRVIGAGVTRTITGSREPGFLHRQSVCFGPRHGGAGTTARTRFNQGYWGPTVGFYGGVNYGYGYTGNGYWGGRWNGNTFNYNTAVTRVNTNVVHNTYVNNSVTNQLNANRASFNGPNGVNAQETAAQKAAAANAKKIPPTSQQLARQQAASKDQNLRASVNKGKPNADAINSFNKSEGVGQGKGGAQGLGAAAGAGAGKGENKIGNASELNRQGAGAGQGKGGAQGPGTEAGVGKAENKPGNVAEHHAQGAGGSGQHANKVAVENHANKQRNLQGNQAKAHSAKSPSPEVVLLTDPIR